MPFITTQDGTNIFYKDWGNRARAAHRLSPRLAAERGRLGHADALLPRSRATA
jgi:hypothetical protein